MHHFCGLIQKICTFNIFPELSQKCAHAHAGHTQVVLPTVADYADAEFLLPLTKVLTEDNAAGG